jgi:hypothetical protein
MFHKHNQNQCRNNTEIVTVMLRTDTRLHCGDNVGNVIVTIHTDTRKPNGNNIEKVTVILTVANKILNWNYPYLIFCTILHNNSHALHTEYRFRPIATSRLSLTGVIRVKSMTTNPKLISALRNLISRQRRQKCYSSDTKLNTPTRTHAHTHINTQRTLTHTTDQIYILHRMVRSMFLVTDGQTDGAVHRSRRAGPMEGGSNKQKLRIVGRNSSPTD